jgi:hypothetical protein
LKLKLKNNLSIIIPGVLSRLSRPGSPSSPDNPLAPFGPRSPLRPCKPGNPVYPLVLNEHINIEFAVFFFHNIYHLSQIHL